MAMTHWCVMCLFETEDEEEAYAHDCMGPSPPKRKPSQPSDRDGNLTDEWQMR